MTEEEKSPQRALLVLGMHRSGTSAVTRVLNLLGAHLGSELLATKADNKRGFWEHAEVVAVHERLLTALGRAWHDTRELPYGWLDSIAGRKARGEIIALIRRDMETGLAPSPRGELEITDLNRCYLRDGTLMLEKLGRGYAWLDTGTHESLVQASNYIETIENRQGLKVCCPEEIAFLNGWIDRAQLERLAAPLAKTGYGRYLLALAAEGARA